MASKKIGRNDQCPCGSGKKFKKCCINKISNRTPIAKPIRKHPLSTFNRMFLADIIGKAFASPKNHGKNIRLELIMRESLKNGQVSGGSSDIQLLEKTLNKHYPNHHMEDPPEFLFTDIITFFGGDFVVLPGIFSNGHYILSNVLMALFFRENNIPDNIKSIIYSRTILALNVSNEIAKRNNLSRYEAGNVQNNFISIEDNLNDELFISDILIQDWSKQYKVSVDSILHFVLDKETSLDVEDANLNPIILKPLIRVTDGFKVLSVSNIIGPLLNSIFNELIDNDCLSDYLKFHSENVWNQSVEYHLRKMSIAPIKIDFISTLDWTHVGAYKIDLDKIMIVTLNQDDAEGYKKDGLFTSSKVIDAHDEHIKAITNSLETFFPNHEYLIVHLTSGIGRQFGVSYDQTDDQIIGMSVIDFELIMRGREYDPLLLWNYVQAKKRFLQTTQLTPFIDEIDIYALYHQKGQCFYMNDDERPGYLFILPGNSLSFREEIYQKEDIHSISVFDENEILGALVCVKTPEFDRTYNPIDSSILQQVVENEKRPIWIEFDDIENIEISHRDVYIKLMEAISYWIWQIIDSLTTHLEVLPELPLKINFDLRNRSKFEEINGRTERVDGIEKDFHLEVSNQRFKIIIPETINPYLYGSDNEGERILLSKLLEGFSLLLKTESGKSSLDQQEIRRLVELHAPIGIKKKIFLIDIESANDICLLPVDRDQPRYVQDFNVNVVIDDLVPRLVKAKIISGKPETIKDPDSFLKDVLFKVLLEWLNSELSNYDSIDLIKRLYNNTEILVHTRRMNLFTLPPAIACFENYQEQLDKLISKEHDVAQTNVSVRCLIEHISAFPINDGKIASQADFDQLLAIMEQIVAWGMANDMVHFGLSNSSINILPSNRIGTNHSFESDVIAPFRESHAKENIADSAINFINAFPKEEPSDSESDMGITEIDKAFKQDYGITLTRIIEFSNALIGIALTSKHHCEMEELELKTKVEETMLNIEEGELDLLLSFYSLEERKKFFKAPKGFENHDISPWRFNRGISLLRKPLVKIKRKDSNSYIWGARQVELASQQILSNLYSGKLRCIEKGALSEIKGKMLDKKGTEFTLSVHEFFLNHPSNYILDLEVPMKISKDKNLGDIDVLIIDHSCKTIFLIECKNTSVAKNVKQLVEEVNNLFGSNGQTGWIKKHEARLEWISQNKPFLEKKYSIDLNDYALKAIILTSEELPTKFLKRDSLPFPMISFYDVKESKDPCAVLLERK